MNNVYLGPETSGNSCSFLVIQNPLEGSFITNSDFQTKYEAIEISRVKNLFEVKYNNFVGEPHSRDIYLTAHIVLSSDLEVVDLTENYWGDQSGTTHIDNPEGVGNSVYGSVDYSGWSEAAY
jgi:hypothetical protein